MRGSRCSDSREVAFTRSGAWVVDCAFALSTVSPDRASKRCILPAAGRMPGMEPEPNRKDEEEESEHESNKHGDIYDQHGSDNSKSSNRPYHMEVEPEGGVPDPAHLALNTRSTRCAACLDDAVDRSVPRDWLT